MFFIISVLLTPIALTSIHALQSFLFGTFRFVVQAHKKMPPCPHLISIEEVNVEEIKRKMSDVSYFVNDTFMPSHDENPFSTLFSLCMVDSIVEVKRFLKSDSLSNSLVISSC